MNFTSFGVIEKLYNILYKNEQHKWLAYWLISKFDWGSENIYFYVRESLRKMINNKDISNSGAESVKYAFTKLVLLSGESEE